MAKRKPRVSPVNKRILELEAQIEATNDEKRVMGRQLKEYKKKAAIFQAVASEIDGVIKPLTALPKSMPISRSPGKKHSEDVVMHLSDEHMDEVVEPHTVQGLENYNMMVAMRRAENYVNKVLEITQKDLTNCQFENLWVLAYGDHTNGEIHGGVGRSYYQNQFRNAMAIGQVHAQMFRDLAPYFKKVNVIYVPGNHGRRSQKKDYHGAWDNWDYLVAESARQLCGNMDNVEFQIPNAFSVNVEIKNHVFAIEHGDDIQSWNGIPFYGIERKSRRLVALNATQGKHVHYFVYGHFHRPSDMSDLDGGTIINGTWKATDPYVLGRFSGFVEPVQWLHGVHEEHGITWQYKIKLRSKDDVDGPKRYKINLAMA